MRQRLRAILERADPESGAELDYAEDAVVEDPVGTDPYRGIEAICGFYEGGLGAGAKLELTGNPRCAGNSVAFPFQVVMDAMRIEIIDVFELNAEGKIQSMRAYWSQANTSPAEY